MNTMNISLSRLRSFYSEFNAPLLLHTMMRQEFPGSIAVITSCNAEAGPLLAMVAEINPMTPVLFLDDGKHAAHAQSLARHLGLTHLHRLTLTAPGANWKAELARSLDAMGLLAVITGRMRAKLPRIELDENGVFRINPLADWTKEEHNSEMTKRRNIPAFTGTADGGPDSCDLAIGMEEERHEGTAPVPSWSV